MWKCAVIISLLFCASSLRAQKPVIDSMIVNEDSSQLMLYGNFGTNQGVIFIDSVQLPIISWTDSLILASIPDTGAGSYGRVVVKSKGLVSDTEILSCIIGIYSDTEAEFDPEVIDESGSTFRFIFRLDFRSTSNLNFLVKANKMSTLNLWENYLGGLPHQGNFYDESYNTTFQELGDSENWNYICYLSCDDVLGKEWILELSIFRPVLVSVDRNVYGTLDDTSYTYYTIPNGINAEIDLDSLYHIMPSHIGGIVLYNSFLGQQESTILSGSILSPPDELFTALQYTPTLISPKFDSTNWQPSLTWLLMPFIDSFEIQISSDPAFNKDVQDYVIIDTNFIPTNLVIEIQYYWRVRGKNTDGNTPWSSVWSFGENPSSVKLATDDNGPMLEIKENSIQYKTNQNASLTIYNVLGDMVYRCMCEENGVSQSISLPSLGLRGGNYFVVLRSDENVLSTRFSSLQ